MDIDLQLQRTKNGALAGAPLLSPNTLTWLQLKSPGFDLMSMWKGSPFHPCCCLWPTG